MDPKVLLVALVDAGYMEIGDRDKVERASGDKYAELVRFVTGEAVSPGLANLLVASCPTVGCAHSGWVEGDKS
jgi:hypothetical protein